MDPLVSHKWIAQVFRQRGIPPIDSKTMERAIAVSNAKTQKSLLQAVRTLEQGTEDANTIAWVREVLLSSTANSVKTAGSTQGSSEGNSVGHAPKHHSFGRNHHIYRAKGALTVELDVLRQKRDEESQEHTVRIDGALAMSHLCYEWDKKISFQLTKRELPLMACCLLGLGAKKLSFENHGPAKDKAFHLQEQPGKLFVKLQQGTKLVAVPVQGPDIYELTEIVLLAMHKNSPHISGELQLQMLRRMSQITAPGAL